MNQEPRQSAQQEQREQPQLPAWVTDPALIDHALAEGAALSKAMDRAMRGMRAINASERQTRIR